MYKYFNIDFKNNINILYFDINFLKEANYIYGHTEIDKILNEILEYLKNSEENGISSRIGGDEFIIITDTNIKNIYNEINKILAKKHLTATYAYIQKNINQPVRLAVDIDLLDRIVYYSKYTNQRKTNNLISLKKIN